MSLMVTEMENNMKFLVYQKSRASKISMNIRLDIFFKVVGVIENFMEKIQPVAISKRMGMGENDFEFLFCQLRLIEIMLPDRN